MDTGRVIGGDYKSAIVSTRFGSTIVLQTGLKFRKLTQETVSEWDEVVTDAKGNPLAKVGSAVAGAALPGRLGKAASAAVDATFDAMGRSRVVRVDWTDGKRSLIKLSESMFNHLALVLEEQRAEPAEPAPLEPVGAPAEKPTVTEQAFTLVSGLIKDRLPAPRAESPGVAPEGAANVAELIGQLAALRDAGALSDEEFQTKKAELLGRL
ncbi:hypothetical protein A0130_06160 [Leifsonia xyli]|uniref:SHOCT domain-containing protein n=1 Tax=Leifsonia xyli TaxID=1575 RepID=UPI0007CDA2C1|nr:hypothetical protein A0130_06160 [Leifsonia xyli]